MEPVIIAIITALLAGAVWVLRSTPSTQESLELPNKPFPDEWRKILSDGWTAVTRDKSLSAQFEHSIGITEEAAEIFTLSPAGLTLPPYKI